MKKKDRSLFQIKNVSKKAKDRFSRQAKLRGMEQAYYFELLLGIIND